MFKKKECLELLCLNALIVLASCGIYLMNTHFSQDDFEVFYDQKSISSMVIFVNYRNILGFIYYLLDFFNINVVRYQIIFGIVFMAALAICITRITIELTEILKAWDNKMIIMLIDLGALILFLNAFISEWIWFALAYLQWTVSIIGATYAAIYIGKRDNRLKNWVFGFVFLVIAEGSYQIASVFYVYIVMTIIFIRNKNTVNKNAVIDIFRAAVTAVGAVICNILFTRFLSVLLNMHMDSRIKLTLDLVKQCLIDIIKNQKYVWIDGLGVFPNAILLLALVSLVYLLGKCMRKRTIISWIYLFIVLLSGHLVMYMLIMSQGLIYLTMRVVMPLFGIFSALVWIIAYYAKLSGTKKYVNIACGIMIVFISVNCLEIQNAAVDSLKTNALDKLYFAEIQEAINEYELSSHIEITKVGFCTDKYRSYKYYDEISPRHYSNECMLKSFAPEWSDILPLNYYTKRNYTKVDIPENVRKEFEQHDWTVPALDQQLVFDHDTIYICFF